MVARPVPTDSAAETWSTRKALAFVFGISAAAWLTVASLLSAV